jgi:hypothetical protein
MRLACSDRALAKQSRCMSAMGTGYLLILVGSIQSTWCLCLPAIWTRLAFRQVGSRRSWHHIGMTNHVKGLSKLVEKYADAELAYPGYLGSKEGLEFLTAYGGAVEPSTRGTKELFRSFKAASPVRRHPVFARHIVFEGTYAHGDVRVVAFVNRHPRPTARRRNSFGL